ncbi:unnamed protein product [Rhizoctonia solani]|uniref:Cell wall protein n=1 Tax=Rhizoctonia solani TaxID=456999 RepID=A0A8H3EA07_9AGAM|nr:unnamed protein product [Rhizoctonia solani]
MVAFRNLTKIATVLFFSSTAVCAAPSRVDRRQGEINNTTSVNVKNPPIDELVIFLEQYNSDVLAALEDANAPPNVVFAAAVRRINTIIARVTSSAASANNMDDATKTNLVRRTRAILPHYAQTCTMLANKSFFQLIQAHLSIVDLGLNTLTTSVSRLGGVSVVSLAPRIGNNPSAMEKCFPETASTIASSSS